MLPGPIRCFTGWQASAVADRLAKAPFSNRIADMHVARELSLRGELEQLDEYEKQSMTKHS
jgi:hypothetical protein